MPVKECVWEREFFKWERLVQSRRKVSVRTDGRRNKLSRGKFAISWDIRAEKGKERKKKIV
jgi:hypothetical protein